ncbi:MULTISPECIES: hypothetical protein [unclassified Paludibacterium]|uniref:hypothetical protein n=1 Tax=unclassified Paludibacterium TaxID=2618429 RepID=UPI001C05C97D|nr:hypothetical protein [Paludibacterium sp. B53371]
MPGYSATINIPENWQWGGNALIVRIYQPWGDGSETGWQKDMTPPTVTLDDGSTVDLLYLSGFGGLDYLGGSNLLGYDQYAQYYAAFVPAYANQVTIHGTFQQYAFMNVSLDNLSSGEQIQIYDQDMATSKANPFRQLNPSVFAYQEPFSTQANKAAQHKAAPQPSAIPPLRSAQLLRPATLSSNDDGAIAFYRPDQQTSQNGNNHLDGIAADGCSANYLTAYKQPNQEMMIMRIKVPKTFISADKPDLVFKSYQARYFSVSANTTQSNPTMPYWTVNGRMLDSQKDQDGYAYVFFGPNSDSRAKSLQYSDDPNTPPVITWGKYRGYYLGNPDYAVILRYKLADENWQGSPIHAACYASPAVQQPVTAAELGDYLPEMYGDSMDNFNAGHIGAVSQNQDWPSH